MDIIMFCIFVCLGLLVFFFICYAVTTKKIIRGQEKEIAALRTKLHRIMSSPMKGEKKV